MSKIDLSLILACYNEGPTFEKNVNRILDELKKLRVSAQIIFVEDNSADETKNTIEAILKRVKNSKAIYHNKNIGRGGSVSEGIKASEGNICGYIDVDCEISPSYIALFVDEVQSGADIVVGNRFYEKGFKSLSRVIASRVYAKIIKLTLNIPVSDTEAGFKFFNRKKILPILSETKNKGWFWDTEVCARTHYNDLSISQIPVLFVRRVDKKSTVKLFADSLDYLINLYKFKSQITKRHLNK